jgi:hypothetical protein
MSVAAQVSARYKRKIEDFCLKNIYSGKLVNIPRLFTVPKNCGVFVKKFESTFEYNEV